jgi:hypothetical protein
LSKEEEVRVEVHALNGLADLGEFKSAKYVHSFSNSLANLLSQYIQKLHQFKGVTFSLIFFGFQFQFPSRNQHHQLGRQARDGNVAVIAPQELEH